jgi:hypothetical protein
MAESERQRGRREGGGGGPAAEFAPTFLTGGDDD